MLTKFWNWYERHRTLALGVTAGLFLLQIIHLFWLLAHVIALRALGYSFFDPSRFWEVLILLVDYTEIPALIATSIVYIGEIRARRNVGKSWLYLVFLNTQWLHLFWITDEFVVKQFADPIGIPTWLAWTAILIDYLEVPVIIDTLKKFFHALLKGDFRKAVEEIKERD